MNNHYNRWGSYIFRSQLSALNTIRKITDDTPYLLLVRSDWSSVSQNSTYHVCDVDEENSWYDSECVDAEFSDRDDIGECEIISDWQPDFPVNDKTDIIGVEYYNRSARVIDVNLLKHGYDKWNVHEVMPKFNHFKHSVISRKQKVVRQRIQYEERDMNMRREMLKGRDGFIKNCCKCNDLLFITRQKEIELNGNGKKNRFCIKCMQNTFTTKSSNKMYINHRHKLNNGR